jgi:polysaccharide biosynthesis/export protein
MTIVVLFGSCKTQNIFDAGNQSFNNFQDLTVDSSFYYQADYQYKIRKGDKITISIWGQDDISVGSLYTIYNSNEVFGKWVMVDARGFIELPKIGSLHVHDLTQMQLKDSLKSIYGVWIKNPVIDVRILNKEITVMGEVRSPGVVLIDKENSTILESVARTGGFNDYANIKKLKVLRQVEDHVKMVTIDLSTNGNYFEQNIQLQPGDVLVVPSKRHKEFDRRISVLIPFTTAITAGSIILGLF